MVWRVIRLSVVVDWITARVRFVSVVTTKVRQIDRGIKLQTRILGANSWTFNAFNVESEEYWCVECLSPE
jgi:hypothetical protein